MEKVDIVHERVDVIPLPGRTANGYNATNSYNRAYRSETTRELDKAFNLTGKPLTDDQTAELVRAVGDKTEERFRDLTEHFATLAGELGSFVGVDRNGMPFWDGSYSTKKGKLLKGAIEEGLFQRYEHYGIVIEPSKGYAAFAPVARIKRLSL